MRKLITVVTTFLNEEEVLPQFYDRVKAVLKQLPQYDHEILFVDDHSTDGSLQFLREKNKADPTVKILVTTRRFGVYPCVRAGLNHAQGDAVIYLETDLQDPPELIPDMVAKWEKGADVVYTTRSVRLGESKMKMAITGWAYRTINRLSEVKIPVDTGDYKLISRKVLDHMNSLPEHDPYFRGMVSWVGFKQEQLLYRRDPRPAGRSTRSLMSFIPLRVFVSAVLASSTKPLVWIALSCIPLFLLSVMGLVLLALFPTSTLTLAYSAGLCILMLLSVQLSLGAVGLYLARVYHDVRGRPAYLIKETIGS